MVIWAGVKFKVSVTLRQTVIQCWYRAPSGAYDQILVSVLILTVSSLWDVLSDEWAGHGEGGSELIYRTRSGKKGGDGTSGVKL